MPWWSTTGPSRTCRTTGRPAAQNEQSKKKRNEHVEILDIIISQRLFAPPCSTNSHPKSITLSSSNVFFVDILKPEVTGNYITSTEASAFFRNQNRTHFKQKYYWTQHLFRSVASCLSSKSSPESLLFRKIPEITKMSRKIDLLEVIAVKNRDFRSHAWGKWCDELKNRDTCAENRPDRSKSWKRSPFSAIYLVLIFKLVFRIVIFRKILDGDSTKS